MAGGWKKWEKDSEIAPPRNVGTILRRTPDDLQPLTSKCFHCNCGSCSSKHCAGPVAFGSFSN